MRYSMFPALSLATLLLACAHDAKNQTASERTTPAERIEARAERHERQAENETRRSEREAQREEAQREHGDQQLDMPRRRGDRGRVASANGIPERREQAGEGRGKEQVSAFDQGNSEVDLDLTQRIRKAVMADDALSFKAKNVKIITRDGHVNLHGSVNTPAEKDAIYKCAVGVAGVGHVTNQLEIDGD